MSAAECRRWDEVYTRAVAYLTQFGVGGIGVVPNEWTLDNGRTKDVYGESEDPAVAAFYAALPHFCDCEEAVLLRLE